MTSVPSVTQTAARRLPLHQRIVWARKRKGISQEGLAAQVGTSRRHMIRIEKGLHRPGPVFRARIAEVTEQPPEFFEDEDDEEADPVTDLMAALRTALRGFVRAELASHRESHDPTAESLTSLAAGSMTKGV